MSAKVVIAACRDRPPDGGYLAAVEGAPGQVRWQRWIIGLAVLHTLVLAAYVLPDRWVPARPRFWATTYTRPLWHQQWRLFAPDPRMTSAYIEVALNDSDRRPIDGAFEGDPAMHRMALAIAQYTEDELDAGRTAPSPEMVQAMHSMVRDIGREVPDLRFRLVRERVVDPRRPADRVRTVTDLDPPHP